VGPAITLAGRGPDGETVIAENETALDLFLFKHDLPAYDRPTPKPAAATPAFPKTTIGGRVYGDLSSKDNEDEGTGLKSSDSGIGTDVKRSTSSVNSAFDATWSAKFETDIGDVGAKRYDVFVKNAFLQAKLDDAAIFRIGAADTPWIPSSMGSMVSATSRTRSPTLTVSPTPPTGACTSWAKRPTTCCRTPSPS